MASRYWLLVLILCGANGFPLKCPPPSQRPMRAKVLCSNPATYLCLHDDIKGGFSENCSRVTVEQPGKVTTLNYQGNFDNKPCSANLYQPRRIRYWTNVSTDCIYQKSSCTEEGQVEYDDGGVQSDRTCTCDYTRGYTFVNTPRNPCFCKPSREDCSCYMKTYLNDGIIRSNDMNCSFPFNEIAGHVLPRGMHSDLSLVPTKHHDDTRKNPTNIRHEIHLAFIRKIDKQKSLLTGLVIVTCIILVILTTLLYYATIEKTYGCYNLKRLTNKYLIKEQIQNICEFCSNQRDFRCENCQQDMCCECFDKHQPSDTERSHSGVIYDKFVLERYFDVYVNTIPDMVVLPDGLLVYAVISDHLVTYAIDSGDGKTITLHIHEFLYNKSLTVIDNDNVAVLYDIGVSIVDVRQDIITNFTFEAKCSGVMCIDNMLYVGCEKANSWSIQILDISELEVQKTIPFSYKPRCLRYGHNGRIYCLTDTRVVVIFDLNWHELFILKDLNMPRTLKNITVDNNGNAIVLSYKFKGSLIKITPNGKTFPVLSLKKNIDIYIECLGFSEDSRLLHFVRKKISIYRMQK